MIQALSSYLKSSYQYDIDIASNTLQKNNVYQNTHPWYMGRLISLIDIPSQLYKAAILTPLDSVIMLVVTVVFSVGAFIGSTLSFAASGFFCFSSAQENTKKKLLDFSNSCLIYSKAAAIGAGVAIVHFLLKTPGHTLAAVGDVAGVAVPSIGSAARLLALSIDQYIQNKLKK